MSDSPDHFCPGCGIARRAFARYPWHLCNDCCETACDTDGRRLVFANASLSGGFVWGFADEDVRYSSGAIIALINHRPVVIGEARFGGVVAQPYFEHSGSLIDVRRPGFDRKNLRPYPAMRSGHAPGTGRL